MKNETDLFGAAIRPPKPAPATGPKLAALPFWMPLAAGLPLTVCMAIMDLPDLNQGRGLAFDALFLCAFVVWIFPLTLLQRVLWRRSLPWRAMAPILLTTTYAMSVMNNLLGHALAMGLGISDSMRWSRLFSGLDGCWLALIAFCAIHAVLAYYTLLGREQVRVAEALAMARDAELRALRYQVHPHFLFNTLNAISSLVANERNRDANRMIAQLAEFLRATLDSAGHNEHPLADELALTESYLDIEKARLGERLKIAIHVGPDVLQALVPYLVLQPLVENAIRHGIAPRSEPGRLDLHIARVGDRLHIELENEGPAAHPGIDATARPSFGLGTRNVSERLAKLYGDDHSFAVSAGAAGNFCVRIDLPLHAAGAPA
ncbi:MAG: histidine kinase [Pseudomonadota bacterium]